MLRRLSLLLLVASFSLAAQAQDMDVETILSNYFENTGGIENWKNLNTMKMAATMSMQGMEFSGTVTMMRPNKQRMEFDVMGQKMIQAYDGEDAWMLFPMQTGPDPQTIPAEQAEELTKEEFEDAFIDYAAKGHTVSLEGKEDVEGAETYVLKLTKKNGDVEYHYFDAEYFVPIMQKAEITTGPAKGQFAETFMSDYQEVNGFMVPYFIETKMAGQSVNKLTITSVEMDPEVDETIFSRPKKD